MIAQELSNGHVNSAVTDTEPVSSLAHPVERITSENDGTVNTKEISLMDPETPEEILDQEELKSILEALLFVSHDPITLEKLSSVLEGLPKGYIKSTIQGMQTEWEHSGRGLQIKEVAGGFVLMTRPEYSTYIKRLTKAKPLAKLSRSALETLAIIGYKQPITRADIEKIRGVETSGVLRTLLDQKLLRIVGRQDIPGRPILYGTSKQFLQRYGLRDLRDLPPLKELNDLGQAEHLLAPELPFESEESEGTPQVTDLSA